MRKGDKKQEPLTTQTDIKQLERLFLELKELLDEQASIDGFKTLVLIERKLDEYRLQQTLSGQEAENCYAAKLESTYKNS
ncbi:hypothetical protein MFLO_00440 [Listeria floridensis FSL S10-1187]|uniref:Uncharacterized protein n=1 Tax=Listeria floridensis FSL S10-1187 TaxID=1265817 RepID=A0ABN0RIC0_9LIST|nr:hypothetical protein [Listeria floridensis]EUJ33672.1 hypothetical protein MFLO_00440 [Listeria floridensis FSL S10-1187]